MKRYLPVLQLVLVLLLHGAAQAQPTASGLVGYWRFNEGTGSTAADGSPSGYTASLLNSPGWSAAGREGSCLEMNDAQGRRAEVAALTWQPTNFTVSFWLHPYALSTWGQQIGSSIGWGGFYFHTTPGGEVYVGTNIATRMDQNLLKAGTVGTYRWQHFTFSYTYNDATGNGTGRFYKNGLLLASKAAMARPLAWQGFRMGAADAQGALHGRLDEVRVYNRALSDAEVKELAAWPGLPAGSTWNPAAATTEWNNAANWLEGYAPHAATEEVVINACTNCPRLSAPATVKALTMNGGGLDLNGYSLSCSGNAVFYRGTVGNGTASAMGSLTTNGPVTSFGNSLGGAVIGVPLTINSASVAFHYSEFKEAVGVTRTGLVYDESTGGNRFWKKLTIVNAGNGMALARRARDIYEGDVELSLTGSSTDCSFYLAYTPQNLFNGDIIFRSTIEKARLQWTGFFFEGSAPDCAILKEGKQIKAGTGGFSFGYLSLKGFTQQGPTPQALEMTGPTLFVMGPGTTFNGPVDFRSSNFSLDGVTFQQKTYLEKKGGWENSCKGNNVFNGPLHFRMNTRRWLSMATATRDVFNDELLVESTGYFDGYITFSANANDNLYNGDILVTHTGSDYLGASGIIFGGGSSKLAAGRKIRVAPTGFPFGYLTLQNFQQSGTTSQVLSLTDLSVLNISIGTQFNGSLNASAGRLFLYGGTFRQPVSFTKLGSGADNSKGSNVYYDKLILRNQGPANSAINLATEANDRMLPPPQQ